MKPTPKEFASRLAPSQGNFSVLATTPWISSMCPATLVRLKLVRCPHSLGPTLVALPSMSLGPLLHSPGSRTPVVMYSTLVVAYDVFFPRKHPSGFPSMSHRLIRLQPESLSLSGLPIHVAHIPAAPFPRTPFSLTHDLPSSLMRSLSLCHRYLAAFPSTPWLPITRCSPSRAVRKTGHRRNDGRKNRLEQ